MVPSPARSPTLHLGGEDERGGKEALDSVGKARGTEAEMNEWLWWKSEKM